MILKYRTARFELALGLSTVAEKLFDIPRRLPDALFILDQRKTDKALTFIAKARAGCDRDSRFRDQPL